MSESETEVVIEVEIPQDFKSLIHVDSTALIAHIMSLDGVHDFNEEFMMWQEYLSRLEPYDDDTISEKLRDVDLTNLMPPERSNSAENAYQAYYRLVETQRYLYSLQKPVSNRVEMLKDAIKSLRSAARGMFKGTDKDKEAHSDRMVRNFTAELSRAKCLLGSINASIETVEFAAMQASRVIKEKEFELKVNGSYTSQGQSSIYNRHLQAEEEDDDSPVPSKYRRQS